MKLITIPTTKLLPLQPSKVSFEELEKLIETFETDGNMMALSPVNIKQESESKYSVLRGIDTALMCHIYGKEAPVRLWENLSEIENEELKKQYKNSRLNLQRTREIGIYNLQDLLDIDEIRGYVAQQHNNPVKKQVKKRLVEYLGVG